MKFIRNGARNMGVAGELLSFFMRNKRWWLVPMVVSLFLIGALIILDRARPLRRSSIRCSRAQRYQPRNGRESSVESKFSESMSVTLLSPVQPSTRSSAESKPNTRLRSGLWIGALCLVTGRCHGAFLRIGFGSGHFDHDRRSRVLSLCSALSWRYRHVAEPESGICAVVGSSEFGSVFFLHDGRCRKRPGYNWRLLGSHDLGVHLVCVLFVLDEKSPVPEGNLYRILQVGGVVGVVCFLSCAYAEQPFFSLGWIIKLFLAITLLAACNHEIKNSSDLRMFLMVSQWAFAFLLFMPMLRLISDPAVLPRDGCSM